MIEQALTPAQCDCVKPGLSSTAVTDRLANARNRLQGQLDEVQAALDALAKNPELAKILDLVARAMRH